MKLKVDIDNVIRDMGNEIVNIYNKEFGTSMTKEDIIEYDVSKAFPLLKENSINAKTYFFNSHSLETYLYAKPMPDAIAGLELAKQLGCEIILVSYQPNFNNKLFTLEWLEKNNVKYDTVIFTNKEDKSMVDADYIIDDNPKFLDADKAKTVCIDWTYNRHKQYDYRVKSILEFIKNISL